METPNYYLANDLNIPYGVQCLEFSDEFNEPLGDSIPETVICLIFGEKFNQPLGDSIPDGVTHLAFGASFKQQLIGTIPNSVTHLIVGENFLPPDGLSPNDEFPYSVRDIIVGWYHSEPPVSPPSVVSIGHRISHQKMTKSRIRSLDQWKQYF